MFSNTTIAASRTMPTAKARPAREMILIVRPAAFRTMNVTNRETGIASATIIVARKRRMNHHSTAIARKIPSTRLLRSMAIESVM